MTTSAVAGNTTHTAPSNLTHYPALDGLRAIAFFAVVLDHYYGVPWGFGGVNVFFVLSGFLITGILVDTRDRPHRARNFYIRRALRIFPLYYGVLLALLLLTPMLHWRWSLPWVAWPLYLGNFLRLWGGNTHNALVRYVTFGHLHSLNHPTVTVYLGHFWSLCVEEQFYLIWPWVVFRVRSRKALLAICASVAVLGPIARSLAQNHTPTWMASREMVYVVGVPFQMDALLLGGLLALLWRGAHRERLQRAAKVVLALGTVLGIVYFAHQRQLYPSGFRTYYQYPDWRITWDLSLINLYGAALLLCALQPGSLVYRVLNVSPLRYIGRISYGMYVLHDLPHPVYAEAVTRLRQHAHIGQKAQEPATLALGFFATLLLASISYEYFEKPFLALKEKWAPSRRFESAVLAPTR